MWVLFFQNFTGSSISILTYILKHFQNHIEKKIKLILHLTLPLLGQDSLQNGGFEIKTAVASLGRESLGSLLSISGITILFHANKAIKCSFSKN